MSDTEAPPTDWKKPTRYGFVLIFLTFVVVGGWSAYAELASAIVATGSLSVETNRKTVQHLEGGIVHDIMVREGQRVAENELLFRLDGTQTKSTAASIRGQLDTLIGAEARLMTEVGGRKEITFPTELLQRINEPSVAEVLADQTKQFEQRRSSVLGQKDLLESKIIQFKTEIQGLKVEREATQRQLAAMRDELKDMIWLADKNLVQKTRVTASKREEARLEGILGRSIADSAKAENAINEAALQIKQLDQKFLEEAAGALVDMRFKIADLREKNRSALEVASRLEIRSPSAGVIQNLRVFTSGAVLRPGDMLLEIAPENEKLIVQAHISPLDMDNIAVGQRAEIKLPAFPAARMPMVFGTVLTVSRDRLLDETNKQPYFLAQIEVDMASVPDFAKKLLVAGMPADIVVPTRGRTVLAYVVEPFFDRMWKSFREE